MNRAQAISDLAHMMSIIQLGHPVRVGIDGVDASGKTMLADELVDPTQARGRDVIRVSVDGFHNPRKTRYRQGRTSPSGFYDDSFNHDAIVSNVLKPLGPRGDLRYRPVFFDFSTNSEVNAPWRYAKPDAVLLFDGIFLHRTELMKYWDFSIFVHADFDVTIERAQKRDLYLFETEKKILEIYKQRYAPGQQIYFETEAPFEKANVIWNNNDIENPVITLKKAANKTNAADAKSRAAD